MLVADHSAALVALYASPMPYQLRTESTLSTTPLPARSAGRKVLVTSRAPQKLVSKSSRTAPRSPVTLAPFELPALLMRTVTSPVDAAASATESWSVTSSLSGTMRGSFHSRGLRAAAYTLAAPRSRAWLTKWVPRPPFAPVTRTTAFARVGMWVLLFEGERAARYGLVFPTYSGWFDFPTRLGSKYEDGGT